MSEFYVSNFPFAIKDEDLKSFFAQRNIPLTAAKIARAGRGQGARSKGFGFVTLSSPDDSEKALALNGAEFSHGDKEPRKITVSPRRERPTVDIAQAEGEEVVPAKKQKKPKVTSDESPPPNKEGATKQPRSQPQPQQQPKQPKQPKPFNIHRSPEPIIDVGANLASKNFPRASLAPLLKQAYGEANVSHIVITGSSLNSSNEAIKICKSFDPDLKDGQQRDKPRLYCTVGVHPHSSGDTTEKNPDGWIERLEKMISDGNDSGGRAVVKSVGECGLDYDRDFSPRPTQVKVFRSQMELASKLNMPVFLHCRGPDPCFSDFVGVLKDFPKVKKCVHCYTDPDIPHLRTLVNDLGAYIGITGWVCDERSDRGGAELAHAIGSGHLPLSRLVIETDSPYLLPRSMPKPWPKRNNEPALLGWVLKKVAESMDTTEEEVAKETTKTAKEFFGIDD